MRIPFWQIITAVIVTAFLLTGGWYYYQSSNRIIWTMIHLDAETGTGDAHLLELPNGEVLLIDTGFEGVTRRAVIPHLEERGIRHIDQLIITDTREYHYQGVASLLERPGNVGRVYFNVPTERDCSRPEPPAGCADGEPARTRRLIESSGAVLEPFSTDDVLYYDEDHDIILEAVYVHEQDLPEPRTDATGTLLRLIYGTTTVLFTGDVTRPVGDRLVDEHFFLESLIMTAPSYRPASGAASADFLGTVNARAIMVSDSANRWRQSGNERMRQFAYENSIPTYVTGLHGDVTVTLERDGFSVDTEHAAPAK